MNKIRKIVRSLINEMYGIVPQIDMLAEYISETVLFNINHHVNINFKITTQLTIDVPEELRDKLSIRTVFVDITNDYKENDMRNIKGGQFDSSQTQLVKNDNNNREYSVNISVNLNWNKIIDIKQELSRVFAHELHHAYTHIIRLNKESKTAIHNDIKNSVMLNTVDLNRDYPPIKRFINCFYLTLSTEINARVQEAYNEIKMQHGKNTEEITNRLKQTRAWGDAETLSNYDVESLLNLPETVITELLKRFKQSKDTALLFSKQPNKNLLKFPINNISFFRYWSKKFNRAGQNLAFKLIKNTGALLEVGENRIMGILGEQEIYKVTGDVLNSYNDYFALENEFLYDDYF